MTKHRLVNQLNGNQTAWVDIPTAASELGMTSEAIRQRIKRKTLHGEKRNGRWYVALDRLIAQPEATEQPTEPQLITNQSTDQSVPDELIDHLRRENAGLREEQARLWEEVTFLRQTIEIQTREIEAWIDEAKRKDLLLAHHQDRIVDLFAGAVERPSDAPESPQSTPEGSPEPQGVTQMYRIPDPAKRPWWQFWRRP